MYKAFQASKHCLHLPFPPTPPTFTAVASHSLLVPRNFMPFTAPTAANISSCLVISAAKSFPLPSCTSIQAGEFFVYKSVLQVTGSNLRIHHTCKLLQAISFIRPQYAPLHFTSFSLAGSVIRGRLLRQRPLIPAHKAEPRFSAQLLNMLHQPAFIAFHSLRSFRSSFTQSLSQPHSSIPVWQPGYCHRTFFRLAGRFLSHILCYSDWQARKPLTT